MMNGWHTAHGPLVVAAARYVEVAAYLAHANAFQRRRVWVLFHIGGVQGDALFVNT